MDGGAYKYLKSIGFTSKELEELEENDYIWETSRQRCEYIVDFFKEKGLSMEEIHTYFMNYPNIVSEHPHRLLDIDEIFNNIGLTNEEKKKLILENYETYSSNPDELQKIVNCLKGETKEQTIQNIFNNSQYIAEDFDKVKELIRK
jgi:hypothetical protein